VRPFRDRPALVHEAAPQARDASGGGLPPEMKYARRRMTATATPLHHLSHAGRTGVTSAVVVPAWGANVVAFAFHRADLLWPMSYLEPADLAAIAARPTSFGAPLLAPTPGRVGAAEPGLFRFDGAEYRMAHARHGFLRTLSWDVAARTESSIECVADVGPSAALGTFPFAFRAEYSVSVGEGRLDCRLRLSSTSDRDQPISVGWHPYLYREPGARLRIPAGAFWALDASPEPVPTGERQPVAGDDDFRAGRTLRDDERWDHTFTALSADADGRARSWLENETTAVARATSDRVPIRVRRIVEAAASELPNVQLYTTPGRPALAVEPFSSPPNALALLAAGRTDTNVRRLTPRGSLAFEMAMVIEVHDRTTIL
jgi:aldose 1-epimerase